MVITRHRTYQQLDEAPLVDGDVSFAGVNMRLRPGAVGKGLASGARNKRFTTGAAATRKGIAKMAWSNRAVYDGDPVIHPFNRVWGSGEYRDADGRDWLIIAADGYVYKCREFTCATRVPLPTGVTIEEPVRFLQCMKTPQEALLMLRGTAQQPLAMLVMENLSAGFGYPAMTTPGSGLLNAPDTSYALYLQNRVLYVQYPDIIFTSEPLDYTIGRIFDDIQINRGEGGHLTALVKFTETSFIAAKDKAIHRVSNFYGDLSSVSSDLITSEFGCKAPDSFAQCGSDVWFLADRRGVVSIQQTDFDKQRAVQVPVSRNIQPLIDRIDWTQAHLASAAYHDNKYYLAVPLDNGEELRADIIDHVTGAVHDASGNYVVSVTPGRTYRIYPGESDVTFVNGGTTQDFEVLDSLEAASKPVFDFVAEEPTVNVISNIPNSAVTTEIRPVFKGNNAVLVFDFLTNEWAGYDNIPVTNDIEVGEGLDLTPQTFRILTEDGDPITGEDDDFLRTE